VGRLNTVTQSPDWVRTHYNGGGQGASLARGLRLRDDVLYLTGRVFNAQDGADMFAVAMDPDTGENGKVFFWNSGGFDSGHGIDVDGQGNVYVGGIAGDGFVVLQVPGGSP